MFLTAAAVSCLSLAAANSRLPPAIIVSVLEVEGGKVGTASSNEDGSSDFGPGQINSIWVPEVARTIGIDPAEAQRRLQWAERLLIGTQLLAEQADELAALRCRHFSPREKSFMCAADDRGYVGRRVGAEFGRHRAVDGRPCDDRGGTGLWRGWYGTELAKEVGGFVLNGRGHGRWFPLA